MSEPFSAHSNSSASTSNTTTSSSKPSSKRPPTLDDIAARLKLDSKGPSVSKDTTVPSTNSSDAGRPRLGLTGRLNSNADPNSTVPPATSSAKDTIEAPNDSTSRTKGHKALPSLDDIREHMNKRTFQDASSKLESPQEAEPEPKEGTEGGSEGPTSVATEPASTELKTPPNKSVQRLSSVDSVPETPDMTQRKNGTTSDVSDNHHPLQHEWTMYFDSKTWNPSQAGKQGKEESSSAAMAQQNGYEATLKKLGIYKTVESFMGTFATLRRPTQLELGSNYHFFKDGIKPMWEDKANASGGKWTVMLRGTNPELLNRSWTWLVLALIGEELDEDDDITGAVCSVRPRAHRIALWLRGKDDVDRVNRIGRRLTHLLKIEEEPGVSLEFNTHHSSSKGGGGPSRFIGFQNKEVSNAAGGGGGAPTFSRSGSAFGSQRGGMGGGGGGGSGSGGGGGSRFKTPARGLSSSESSGAGAGASGAFGTPIGRT